MGKILDGRNRWRACEAAGIKSKLTPFRGDDPLAFVISSNLHRRHLNESQRAMVGARLATMRQGARTDLSPNGERSERQAADALNVGKRSVERAREVLNSGTAELIAAVDRGALAVSQAVMLSRSTPAFQQAVIAKIEAEDIKPQEAIRRVKAEAIENKRLQQPTGKYRVIYADPPWDYGNHMQPDEFREQRAHYPVMPLADICALPVKDLAEADAVLFLWTTSPMLAGVFNVIEAWGFTYKASFVWDKVKHVMGHYNSVRHEFLLICTRGSCQPDVRKQYDSVQTIERTTHSKKPAEFYDIIEALYPHGAKIELFARGARPGWNVWGNEAPRGAEA
jgi:N6-adenosine-specific RNA methylase IME4